MEEFNNKELKYIFSDSKEVENLGIVSDKSAIQFSKFKNITELVSYRSKFDVLKEGIVNSGSLNFKTFYINNDGYFSVN
jgi:hypothetical protein